MSRARDWLLIPLAVVVAAIGIAWGGRSSYRALINRSPRAMTCAEFIAHRHAADWVRLEECVASEHVGIETFRRADAPPDSFGTPDAVYVPLRPEGTDAGEAPHVLLLRVDHGPLLRLGSRSESERDADAAADVLSRPIEGLVERSLDRSERDRTKLRELGLRLADDFVVIEYEARPRPLWLGLGVFAVGLGAFAWLMRKWRRRRRPVDLAKATLVAG